MPVFELSMDVSQLAVAEREAARSFDSVARSAKGARKALGSVGGDFSAAPVRAEMEAWQEGLLDMGGAAAKSAGLMRAGLRDMATETGGTARQVSQSFQTVARAVSEAGKSKAPFAAGAALRELVALSARYGSSVGEQNDLLLVQTKQIKGSADAADGLLAAWRELKKLDLGGRDLGAGLGTAMHQGAADLEDIMGQAEGMVTGFSRNFETALTSPIDAFMESGRAGMLGFKSMFGSLLSDLFRMAAARPVTVSIVGAVGGLHSSGGTAQAAGGGGGFGGLNLTDLSRLIPTDSVVDWLGFGGGASSSAAGSLAAQSAWETGYAAGASAYGSAFGEGSAIGAMLAEDAAIAGMEYASAQAGGYGAGMGLGNSAGGFSAGMGTLGAGSIGASVGMLASPYVNKAFGIQNNKGAQTGAMAGGLGTAGVLGMMAAANFWNPAGWVAGALAAVAAIAGGSIGGIAGKERELRVYAGMQTNLADPGAYIQTEQRYDEMLGLFGKYVKDYDSVNVKGSTGSSVYYIDPVHAGNKGDAIASSIGPYLKQVEESMIKMAKETTALLPAHLQKQFTEELGRRPVDLWYKFKPDDLKEKGINAWVEEWFGKAQDVIFASLQALDFSAWEGQIAVNVSDAGGFNLFLNAIQSIENVKTATEELVNPTSQFVVQAKGANAQLDAWALSLRQYGVTQEYAKELMEEYKQTSINVFVKGFTDAFTPLPAFARALKETGDVLDGRIAGLRTLGATEEQIMALEMRRGEVLALAVEELLRQTREDYTRRYTAITGGDTDAVGAAFARENELRKLAQTFGTGDDWTGALQEKAAALNAEKFQGKNDWNMAAVEKAIAEAGMTVEAWYANFGKAEGFAGPVNMYEKYEALLAAEEEKRKLDALKKAQQQYLGAQLSGIRTLVSAWEAVQNGLEDSRANLHASGANPNPALRADAARQAFDDLYAKALAGDADAARQLGAAATNLLDAARRTAATGDAYQLVFNEVDRKLLAANAYAGKQFDAAQAQLAATQAQLDTLSGTNALIGSQVDLTFQILAQTKALEGAIRTIALPSTLPSAGVGQNGSVWSILTAKANAMNREEKLQSGADRGWTPETVLEEIIKNGMSFADWYTHFGKLEGFASGGITPANRPFWVGENGPELMMSVSRYGVLSNPESARLTESLSGAPVPLTPPAYADTRAEIAALRAENQAARAEMCRAVAALERISRHTKDSAEGLAAVRSEGLATRAYTPPPYPVIPFPE